MIELEPINNRKSFYGKCEVIENGDIVYLKSYEIIVATFSKSNNCMQINGRYSKTTKSHIDAFLEWFGFDGVSKKQIENGYTINGIA